MVAGYLGVELPEPLSDREQWASAVECLAMALCEAGYPARVNAVSIPFPGVRENELVFEGDFPSDGVLLRAAELCGIRDLMESAVIDGRTIGA
jgi:hypothetical protein